MTWVDESRAIRAALLPDKVSDLRGACHVASLRLVEAFDTKGSRLSSMWRTARVARGRHPSVPMLHSWVVVDEARIVDVTLWFYHDTDPIHRALLTDRDYVEVSRD